MASIRIIGKILAEQPGNGRCHWQKASGIYRFDFVVGVGKLELPASCSQMCVGTFKRHSAALFGPFLCSGSLSLTLFCPACFKQNFLLLGWVWDWILYIKKVPPRANDDSGPDRNREGAENAPHKQRIAAFACGGGTAAVSCHGNDKND